MLWQTNKQEAQIENSTEKMNPITGLEMAANTTFNSILNEIQLSNLNFKIQMTPFAAIITLKKTALKDKNGLLAKPSPPILFLLQNAQQMIVNIQEEDNYLKATLINCEADIEESNQVKNEKMIEFEKACEDLSESRTRNKEILKFANQLENKLEMKDATISNLKNDLKKLKVELELLKTETKQASKVVRTKEKEVSKLLDKIDNLSHNISSYKTENKTLAVEKNKAVKEKIKLDKKMADLKHSQSVSVKSSSTTSKSTNTISYLSCKSTNTSSCVVMAKATNTQVVSKSESTNTSSTPNSPSAVSSFKPLPLSRTKDPVSKSPWSSSSTKAATTTDGTPTISCIEEGFREFLDNFVDKEGNSNYINLVRELIDSGENILDASISDIKSHNKLLMKLVDDLPYKEAFPKLCDSFRTFIKLTVKADETSRNFLVRLVL